jgi:hypothetical protein
MLKKDSILSGVILGLFAPMLGPVIYYFVVFNEINLTFNNFLVLMGENKSLLTGVSSLSLMANAVFFAICIHFRKDKTAKGIFLATLIYGIGVLLIKVIR